MLTPSMLRLIIILFGIEQPNKKNQIYSIFYKNHLQLNEVYNVTCYFIKNINVITLVMVIFFFFQLCQIFIS